MGKKFSHKKAYQVAHMRNEIAVLRLNVYPECPNEEKPRLLHRIAVLCEKYNHLKAEIGLK